MGDEKEIPQGFGQWVAYLVAGPNMFLFSVNIFALMPIFWLPEHNKTTLCLAFGIMFGFFSEFFRYIDEESKFDRKVHNWLSVPQSFAALIFAFVWASIDEYPAQFLPHWAMGLVAFCGLVLGMIFGSQIRDTLDRDNKQRQEAYESEKRQKQAHAQRALHADIIKLISEPESGSICTIHGVESYMSPNPELIKLIKQLRQNKQK